MKRILTLGLAMALAAAVAVGGPFDSWSYRAKITFAGYNPPGGTETLTNFPALVLLSTNVTNFRYTDFQSGVNADLRFADSTGTTGLNYEIESWNTNGVSSVWVQVPTLASTNDFIYAYWSANGQSAPSCAGGGPRRTGVCAALSPSA